jgi:hypothetical protein
VLTQQVDPENRNGRLDAAAIPPAETSSDSFFEMRHFGPSAFRVFQYSVVLSNFPTESIK